VDKNLLFALDIGTRSVVGMIIKQQDDGKYEILHIKVEEHEERSMLDGQIHHIPAVARVIKKIKKQLEAEAGPLKKVCVAAAGRALKTVKALAQKDISLTPIVNAEEVFHLELAAVQQAQFQLASQLEGTPHQQYDCVGYSVLHYYLDDQEIGSFIGQQGLTASVEVIATFLPRVVVESLIQVLRESELEMEALTLEPIAAINVLIPASMRKLNVALVDIGAGTSDIALTAEGTVIAYGMVPVAGDEITEAISSEYLLDFPVAEDVKRSLLENDSVSFVDILGMHTEKTKKEIVHSISGAVENLAAKITNEILRLNAKAPQAIMLVGGGSLTPGLRERLAEMLNLPLERIAIRGIDAIQSLVPSLKQKGPELVTPVGIGIAARENPVKYINVHINNKALRLFDVKQLTIGDALIAGGADLTKLFGRPGLGLMVRVNGAAKLLKGEMGTPPQILLNGEQSSVSRLVHDGDHIFYQAGTTGNDASFSVVEAANNHITRSVTINETQLTVETEYYVNNQLVPADTLVQDRDEITARFPERIDEVLKKIGLLHGNNTAPFSFFVDGKKHSLPLTETVLYRNGIETRAEETWQNGDHIQYDGQGSQRVTLTEIIKALSLHLHQSCSIRFNGEQVTLLRPLYRILRKGELLKEDSIIYPGDELFIESKEQKTFIFQDVFAQVEVSLHPKPGEALVILKNDNKAGFQTEIETGDVLELKFETRI
jgi:cell division protein FtsA